VNIFYLSESPTRAAISMVDRHVVKMILETCQLLSTAHRVLDGDAIPTISKSGRKITRYVLNDDRESVLYTATHINHPSCVWVRESSENYNWLYWHLVSLCNEYAYRYGKHHACTKLLEPLLCKPKNIVHKPFTQPPCAMDQKYIISDDPVINYRNYYKNGKAHIHSWKRRGPPDWIQINTPDQKNGVFDANIHISERRN
jgi:hypothetical protein